MKTTIALLLAATAFSAPALAQTNAPATAPAPMATTSTTTAPMNASSQWRASKLVGVNVYNEKNESIGEINEVLLDHSGKVSGFVIGVGGFLGMGEHDVLVPFDQVKFVNEPVRTATTTNTTTQPAASGSATAPRPATTGAATTTATVRDKNEKWYPDHAVINSTKEQLKSMQQFKYN